MWPNNPGMATASFFSLMRRNRNSLNQNPIVQQGSPTTKKWTKEDYENYENYLKAQQERELAQREAEFKREEAQREAEFKREEARREADMARREADMARLEESLKHASQFGNIISISIGENGTHSIVFEDDPE